MDKMDREIMVVPRALLFESQSDYFEGYTGSSSRYEPRIRNCFRWMRRGDVENDPRFKQIIPYIFIHNPDLDKYFAYRRAKEHAEERLAGNWSLGIGGHIERTEAIAVDPVSAAAIRELNEEVDGITNPELIPWGWINYDGDQVGSVHFARVYLVKTASKNVRPKDDEMDKTHSGFKSIDELAEIFASPECTVDMWSKLLISPLRYLKKDRL